MSASVSSSFAIDRANIGMVLRWREETSLSPTSPGNVDSLSSQEQGTDSFSSLAGSVQEIFQKKMTSYDDPTRCKNHAKMGEFKANHPNLFIEIPEKILPVPRGLRFNDETAPASSIDKKDKFWIDFFIGTVFFLLLLGLAICFL